ncbi:MAG: hypothetical protein M1838_004054 [Thelocarpon superellum]|nr:MAG: hypothetical protein M1838_004054 [Thelocarpon superellum]
MASSVFFKFKSQKEPSRVTFDGTGISVFELKRAIIEINKLGDGSDFDLAIYNEDTNEEFDDDTSIIPRSTSIIARRLPPARPGRGSAARYVSGKMPVTALNSSRVEKQGSKPAIPGRTTGSTATGSETKGAQSEEDRIAAMFQAGAEQWDKQQQEMANATPVFRSGPPKNKPGVGNAPSHPPPTGYICYRCGEKGHWIQECPTNDNPEFDNRPRVKRTTGIPRSFLKTIEKPAALNNDGLTDTSHQPSGVMVNAEGEFVVAEPDQASWDQYQAKTKVSAAAQEAANTGGKEVRERGLECPIDKKLFVEPSKTPCCGRTYCNDCITNALIESDLTCPGCQTEGILIDNLVPDEEMVNKVKSYIEEQESDKRAKDEADASKPPSQAVGSPSAAPAAIRSSTATPTSTGGPNPKKRAADEALDGQRSSRAPATTGILATNTPATSAGGLGMGLPNMPNIPNLGQMPGFPGMPFDPSQPFGNMGFPNNGFMAMPMGMDMNMMMGANGPAMNPMMINGFGTNGNPNGFMNGFVPPAQPNGLPGGQFGAGMMGNGGYGAGSQMIMGNGGGNMGGNVTTFMNGMQQGMQPAMQQGMQPAMQQRMQPAMQQGMQPGRMPSGSFPNQQPNHFNEPHQPEEDTAYFRQPVNPHRHQARQRRMRPSDYREL